MVPILFYSVRSRVERRMALASSVMHSSVATRNTPGMTMIHQLLVIRAFSAKDSILPQEMISKGRPMPKKLRVDSEPMALRTFMTTMNMMEAMKLGARCFPRMV